MPAQPTGKPAATAPAQRAAAKSTPSTPPPKATKGAKAAAKRSAGQPSLEAVLTRILAKSDQPLSGVLELVGFDLARSEERDGALSLHVRARDHVGFLASLLAYLAGFVLFPEEIEIETSQGEARDELLLTSVGGASPPVEIEWALRASLRSCTRERTSIVPGM